MFEYTCREPVSNGYSITIETPEGSCDITRPTRESFTIHEYFEELIIPALIGVGFSLDCIGKYLKEYEPTS